MRRNVQAFPENPEKVAPNGKIVDAARFRAVLSNFVTGVAVITAFDDEMVGLSANSFTSISLDPPLVGFFAAFSSTTYPRIARAGSFCVNVLAEEQLEIARLFSVRGADRFAEVAWTPSPSGAAILDGAIAWFDCALSEEIEIGDHVLVVGRVLDCDHGAPAAPLQFFRGRFGMANPDGVSG